MRLLLFQRHARQGTRQEGVTNLSASPRVHTSESTPIISNNNRGGLAPLVFPLVCRACGLLIGHVTEGEMFKALVRDSSSVRDRYMWYDEQVILTICDGCQSRLYYNETGWTEEREYPDDVIRVHTVQVHDKDVMVSWAMYYREYHSGRDRMMKKEGMETFRI